MKRLVLALVTLGAASAAATPAFAHLDPVEHGSFLAGFTHPLFGLDHILAMVAVGLWGASLAMNAPSGQHRFPAVVWAVPAAFVVTMALGFAAAIAGVPLPFVEPVILASVIFIGIMVALALPVSPVAVGGIVAFFALFHGHAHGGEMGAAGASAYAAGFLVATALLHAAGAALGLGFKALLNGPSGRTAVRALGGLAGIGGLWLAYGA